MIIRVLGTRGEGVNSANGVAKQSGVLVDNILFDVGEPDYLSLNPKAIFVTHLHPDHCILVKQRNIAVEAPIYAPEPLEGFRITVINEPVTVNGLKVTAIPTVHSKRVKSVAYLIEADSKRILYTGDLIWINERYHNKLRDLDLVITEASSLDRDLIRRDKNTGEIYGHSSAERLHKLFTKLGAKRILFTHFGDWFTSNIQNGESKLKDLGDNVLVARDGMVLELSLDILKPSDVEAVTPKSINEPEYALILVPPHGKLIWQGEKTAIVKSIKLESHIGEPLYLISDRLCWGIITLKHPVAISRSEFKKLYSKHRITEDELREWASREKSWAKPKLYLYEFDFTPFDKPKPIRLKVTGPQVFVNVDNIEFLSLLELDASELEYYHALAHTNVRELGDKWCQLHFELATAMVGMGLYHGYKSMCDSPVVIDCLIREHSVNWINEYINNISKYSTKQLLDDFRICCGWFSSIMDGKRLYKHTDKGPVEITEDDCKRIAVALVRELIKRGVKFSRPESYKPNVRKLIEYVITVIGVENIPFKDELALKLPEGFQPTDIDVSFVNKLSNNELEELWRWLHNEWLKATGGKSTPEDYLNANIIIQIERLKRGLIGWDYEDKDLLDRESRYAWQEYSATIELDRDLAELSDEELIAKYHELKRMLLA